MCPTWVQSCFRSIQYIELLVLFFLLLFQAIFVVSVLPRHLNTILLLYTTRISMLCIVAIGDCIHVHHVVLHKISHLVAIVDCTHIGSATASFKDLVTLPRRTLPIKQQIFWQRISNGSFGHDNSFPGARTPQTKQPN